MAKESYAIVGSGTLPYTTSILPPALGGTLEDGIGYRGGTNVTVINPEDLSSFSVFKAEAFTINTSAVQIAGPGVNPVEGVRKIVITNNTSGTTIYVKENSTNVDTTGIALEAGTPLELGILGNVFLFAETASGSADLRVAYMR